MSLLKLFYKQLWWKTQPIVELVVSAGKTPNRFQHFLTFGGADYSLHGFGDRGECRQSTSSKLSFLFVDDGFYRPFLVYVDPCRLENIIQFLSSSVFAENLHPVDHVVKYCHLLEQMIRCAGDDSLGVCRLPVDFEVER